MRLAIAAIALATVALAWADWPAATLPADMRADRVVIEKGAHRLTLYRGGAPLKSYRVALGRVPVGRKTREGDAKTPEGAYVIDARISDSAFHRALHVSYPNEADREAAGRANVPAGGAIMIHGMRNGLGWLGRTHRLLDWTSGCIAVTNPEIEQIWRAVPNGTLVEITR